MASYGHSSRSRPALYKPTDFGSHQNRTSTTSCEQKEEEKVVRKIIQQRPLVSEKATSDTDTPEVDTVETSSTDTPEADTVETSSKEKMPAKKSDKNKQATGSTDKPGGVAAKDLEKIQKLKDFMAQQQIDAAVLPKNDSTKQGKETEKENKSGKENTRVHKQSSNRSNQRSTNRLPNKNKAVNHSDGNASKTNKPAGRGHSNQSNNSHAKSDSTSGDFAATGNARAKSAPSKTQSGSQKNSSEGHRNRNRAHDNAPQHGINSYYSQPNYPGAVASSSGDMNWLQMQYAMGGTPGNAGILANPYGQHAGYSHGSTDGSQGVSHQKGGARSGTTSKDKSERQKSLDFVKSFFDNDPEVQYHRKQNSEIQPEKVATPVGNPLSGESHVHIHPGSNPPGIVHHNLSASSHSGVYHHNALSPGTLHLGGSPGSLHPGGSPGALHSLGHPSSIHPVSHQSSFSPTSHQTSLHPVGHPSSYNPVSHQSSLLPINHQSFNPVNHQSSMQQNYHEMFSQVNPAMLSPGSSVPGVHQHNANIAGTGMGGVAMGGAAMGGGFSTYSGYFPPSSHQSHVQHVQQQIEPSVIANILQDQLKPKNWQQAALSKCGPIDSSQAQSLIEQLIDNTYECMVCCDSVKWNNPVWSCSNCFHIFHLSCIKKWARSETAAVKGLILFST